MMKKTILTLKKAITMKLIGNKFLWLLLFAILFSCQQKSNISSQLLLADELMDNCPDSSLHILQSIPSTANLSEKEKALHALLLTKAYYKNRIPVESDSLINIAADYFLSGNDLLNKAYTCYYMGRINQKNKNPKAAWENYREAANTAEKTTDNKLIHLIYNHWGILCFEQELYDESQGKYFKSLHYAEQINDSTAMVFILNDIADIYQFKEDYDKMLKYRFRAFEIAQKLNEQTIDNFC